jgi:hypothetical protein
MAIAEVFASSCRIAMCGLKKKLHVPTSGNTWAAKDDIAHRDILVLICTILLDITEGWERGGV